MKSTIKLEIEGLNFESFLKYIKDKNINVFYLERKEYNKIILVIHYSDFNLLKKFYNISNFRIKVIHTTGFLGLIHFIKKRTGILVGVLFFISFLIFNSLFIHKIEIVGLEHISSQEVMNILQENDIHFNIYKKNIDTININKLLLSKFPTFSKVSTIMKGNSLIINIKEDIYVEEMIAENFKPIIATNDGMIKKINLLQGTINCKEGDIVKKGDILVYPFIISSDFTKKYVIPKAEIIADVWNSVIYEINQNETKQVKTGVFYVNKYYQLYSQKIPIHKTELIYDNFLIEEKTSYLTKTILPIKYIEEYVYETKEETFKTDGMSKEDTLKYLKSEVYKNISENQIVNDEFYDITIRDGKTIFTYTIQYEKVISSEN